MKPSLINREVSDLLLSRRAQVDMAKRNGLVLGLSVTPLRDNTERNAAEPLLGLHKCPIGWQPA
jgi:hypothetical protein